MTVQVTAKKSLTPKTDAVAVLVFKERDYRQHHLFGNARYVLKEAMPKLFKGAAGELFTTTQFKNKIRWTFLLGLGRRGELTAQELLRALRTLVRQAQEKGASSLSFGMPQELVQRFGAELLGEFLGETSHIAVYRYTKYKSRDKPKTHLKNIIIYLADAASEAPFRRGIARGEVIGSSINVVRDYGNAPSNEVTPEVLAELARKTARETGQRVTTLNEKEMRKLKMGGILGVSSGSKHEARFIILEHKKGARGERPVVLVGKGITFDSGGISLKPSQAMDEMKFDMSGGGAVIGSMRAVGLLKLPMNVVGIVPATENVPSGTSYKPGDILTYSDGTTVEVLNTDAEGRLILADGLIYARRFKPRAIIDIATLTNAIVVALGDCAAGLFSNNDALRRALKHASEKVGEPLWEMPLPKEYASRMKSTVADVRNIATVSGGGAVTAAKFLEAFVEQRMPWAHLDIAGTAWKTSESPDLAVGATGSGVRTMVQYLTDLARYDSNT